MRMIPPEGPVNEYAKTPQVPIVFDSIKRAGFLPTR